MAGVERRTRRLQAVPGLLAAVAITTACGLVPFDPPPDPEAGPGFAGDCNPPFVLSEETTLGALGIGQFEEMGLELDRVGSIRITEATVRWEDFAPPDVAPMVPEGQLLCVTWPDGSGLSTLLHEPFAPRGIAFPDVGGQGPPTAIVGVTLAVLLVAAAAWWAFRRDGQAR